VRSQAAKALGEQCDSRAFEPLVAALDDDLAAPSAALALMRLGDERAIRPLIECLDPAKSLRLQSAAVRALAGLGGAGVLDRLIDVHATKTGIQGCARRRRRRSHAFRGLRKQGRIRCSCGHSVWP
jgi:HEAT repeat protein